MYDATATPPEQCTLVLTVNLTLLWHSHRGVSQCERIIHLIQESQSPVALRNETALM